MPSEKQIEAATEALKHAMSNEPFLEYEDAVRGILTAAEQAEPVPAARSGAVKVGKLAHLVAGMMNDAGQPRPNGDILHDCLERALPSCLEPAEPAKDAEPYLWLHPWNGSTSKYRSDIAARCPKDGPQPIPLYTRPSEPATDAEPVIPSREPNAKLKAMWADYVEINRQKKQAERAEPATDAEPFGYWVKHKYAEGSLVRTPCFIPEANHYTEVFPLYTHPAEPSTGAEPVAYAYVFDGECEQLDWGTDYEDDPALVLLYTRPSESRLREAARDLMKSLDEASLNPEQLNAWCDLQAALAQEDGR